MGFLHIKYTGYFLVMGTLSLVIFYDIVIEYYFIAYSNVWLAKPAGLPYVWPAGYMCCCPVRPSVNFCVHVHVEIYLCLHQSPDMMFTKTSHKDIDIAQVETRFLFLY